MVGIHSGTGSFLSQCLYSREPKALWALRTWTNVGLICAQWFLLAALCLWVTGTQAQTQTKPVKQLIVALDTTIYGKDRAQGTDYYTQTVNGLLALLGQLQNDPNFTYQVGVQLFNNDTFFGMDQWGFETLNSALIQSYRARLSSNQLPRYANTQSFDLHATQMDVTQAMGAIAVGFYMSRASGTSTPFSTRPVFVLLLSHGDYSARCAYCVTSIGDLYYASSNANEAAQMWDRVFRTSGTNRLLTVPVNAAANGLQFMKNVSTGGGTYSVADVGGQSSIADYISNDSRWPAFTTVTGTLEFSQSSDPNSLLALVSGPNNRSPSNGDSLLVSNLRIEPAGAPFTIVNAGGYQPKDERGYVLAPGSAMGIAVQATAASTPGYAKAWLSFDVQINPACVQCQTTVERTRVALSVQPGTDWPRTETTLMDAHQAGNKISGSGGLYFGATSSGNGTLVTESRVASLTPVTMRGWVSDGNARLLMRVRSNRSAGISMQLNGYSDSPQTTTSTSVSALQANLAVAQALRQAGDTRRFASAGMEPFNGGAGSVQFADDMQSTISLAQPSQRARANATASAQANTSILTELVTPLRAATNANLRGLDGGTNISVVQVPKVPGGSELVYQATALVNAGYVYAGAPSLSEGTVYARVCMSVSGSSECVLPVYTRFVEKRAPVILMHGLWADNSSFEDDIYTSVGSTVTPSVFAITPGLKSSLEKIGYQTGYYSFDQDLDPEIRSKLNLIEQSNGNAGPSLSMPSSQSKLKKIIRDFCKNSIDSKISCTRSILVAHSLGGLVARKYIYDNDYYKTDFDFFRGSVARLITLGTPSYGSRLASVLFTRDFNGTIPSGRPTCASENQNSIDSALASNARSRRISALRDLRPNSDFLSQINSLPQTVPSYAIAGDIGANAVDIIPLGINNGLPLQSLIGCTREDVFQGQNTDGIVPVPSAKGRIVSGVIYGSVLNATHIGMGKNPSVINSVINIINQPITQYAVSARLNDKFEQRPIWQAKLGRIFNLIIPKANAAENPQIVLSLSNTQVQVGDTITVQASVSGLTASQIINIDIRSLSERIRFGDLSQKQGVTSYSFSFKAPRVFSPIPILATSAYNSVDKPQLLISNRQTLTIEPDYQNIRGIVFRQGDPLGQLGYIPHSVGSGGPVAVWALFTDGQYAEITGLSRLRYELYNKDGGMTSAFSITPNGLLTMNSIGEGKLIVRLGNLSLQARLEGYEDDTINGQPIISRPLKPEDFPPGYYSPPNPPASTPDTGLIIDNPEGIASGTWYNGYESSGVQYQGNNYVMHDPVVGGVGSNDWFRWRIPQSGTYDIYASWQAKDNRARNATYSLVQASQTVPMGLADQRSAANNQPGWALLGRYTAAAGDYVQVSASSTGKVVADAIKLVGQTSTTPPPSGNEIMVDDPQGSATGAWYNGYEKSDIQYIGSGYKLRDPIAAGASSTDRFIWTVPQAGTYQVFVRWQDKGNRASDATYTVTASGQSSQVRRNQTVGGGQWNALGTYTFRAGDTIQLQPSSTGKVVADAIRLVPVTATNR